MTTDDSDDLATDERANDFVTTKGVGGSVTSIGPEDHVTTTYIHEDTFIQ